MTPVEKMNAYRSLPPHLRVDVDTRRVIVIVFASCLAAELLFVFLDATVNYSRWTDLGMIRRLFNITREDGMASWFGTTQTLLVALTVWCVWLLKSSETGAGRRRRAWTHRLCSRRCRPSR